MPIVLHKMSGELHSDDANSVKHQHSSDENSQSVVSPRSPVAAHAHVLIANSNHFDDVRPKLSSLDHGRTPADGAEQQRKVCESAVGADRWS